MRMIIYKKNGITHVEMHGFIADDESRILEEEFQNLIRQGEVNINIDLSKVLNIDKRGLNSILNLWKNSISQKGICSVINPQVKVREALEKLEMAPVILKHYKHTTSELKLEAPLPSVGRH